MGEGVAAVVVVGLGEAAAVGLGEAAVVVMGLGEAAAVGLGEAAVVGSAVGVGGRVIGDAPGELPTL